MKVITSLQEFIECIPDCDNDEYVATLNSMQLCADDFKDFINFSKEKYIRNCVAKSEKFELILLAWEKGQYTPIHDHDAKEGWVYNLQGKFEEVCYKLENGKLIQTRVAILNEGETTHAKKDINGFHSIRNIADGQSLSLHLYKKPILECRVFNEESQKLDLKEMAYDFE